MVFKIPNAVIDGSIDSMRHDRDFWLQDVIKCARGRYLSRAEPERMNRLPCLLLSPKSPKMLPDRHVLR
eukprot:1592470-Prymnesium_polylepis.1